MHIEYKKPTLQDKELIDSFFKEYPSQFSKFNFTTLFCWRNAWNFQFAIYKNHLLIKNDYQNFEPVGPQPTSIMKEIGGTFHKVSADTAQHFSNAQQEPAHFDYIYLTKEMQDLEGSRFVPKRNFIHQFEKYNPQTCILDNYTKEEFKALQQEWIKSRDHIKGLALEHEANIEAINHFIELGLHGVCVRVEGEVVAFAIGEKIGDTFYEYFEKGDINYKGVYQYVFNQLAQNIDTKYINRGQDIGIEGIRKAKKSYHPVKILEKYTVNVDAQS